MATESRQPTGASNSILQSQRVLPRKTSALNGLYLVQGTTAMKSIEQHPAHRAPPVQKPHPMRGSFAPQQRVNPKHEPAKKQKAQTTNIPPLTAAADLHPEQMPETKPRKEPWAWLDRIHISPNLMLIILSVAAIVFFSYHALLWNNDEFDLKLSDDDQIRKRLLEYAMANASVRMPADDMIFNTNETFAWLNYTIKKGDTVSKIALDHSLSMDAIIASNNMVNARSLREGEIIRIPNMDGIPYTVASGDSYKKIADHFNVPLDAILDANDIQDDTIKAGASLFIPGAKMRSEDLKMAMGELFIYPIRGRLTSPYGWRKDPFSGSRRYHRALDLAAPSGTPIKAAMAGKVTSVGYNDTFGNYIIISHAGGYKSMYAHLSSTAVKQGAGVNQGTKIGEVGSTGHSTGPHLHFAIYKNDIAVNPLDYLKI
jgi:murein DD-endopeptidase MepM/ murein hydrolase activator NlpD